MKVVVFPYINVLFYVKKQKGSGFYVMDEKGRHVRFREGNTGREINYFSTSREAEKMLKDLWSATGVETVARRH